MTLESAERLVERILLKLGVPYQVERTPEGDRRIVADASSAARLPDEIHPFVTVRDETSRGAAEPNGDE